MTERKYSGVIVAHHPPMAPGGVYCIMADFRSTCSVACFERGGIRYSGSVVPPRPGKGELCDGRFLFNLFCCKFCKFWERV